MAIPALHSQQGLGLSQALYGQHFQTDTLRCASACLNPTPFRSGDLQLFEHLRARLYTMTNNSITKWAKGMNRYISKEDKQMANMNRKRCSISSVIRKMQIKTTMRCCFICTKVDIKIIFKKDGNKC